MLLVASCGDARGGPIGPRTIDPNLPAEDPVSYPDYPIVVVPPVIACPVDPPHDCRDAGASDATDAGDESSER
jgi:hypothetical protein